METPLRMCIACKEMKEKKSLIRIVKDKNGIFVDDTFKAAGRGAYLCNSRDCFDKAVKRKLLNKAFKCEVAPSVYASIAEKFDDR